CAPSVTTTYYVEATDSLGATATDSGIITVNPVPVIDSHNTIDVSCFGGMDGSSCPVVSGGVQPYVYAWGTVHTTQCLTKLAYGNYHYTVADVNGCIATETIVVNEPAPLEIGRAAGR